MTIKTDEEKRNDQNWWFSKYSLWCKSEYIMINLHSSIFHINIQYIDIYSLFTLQTFSETNLNLFETAERCALKELIRLYDSHCLVIPE